MLEILDRGSKVRVSDLIVGDQFWYGDDPAVLVGKFATATTGNVGVMVAFGDGETAALVIAAGTVYDRVIVVPMTPVIEAEIITGLAAKGIEF